MQRKIKILVADDEIDTLVIFKDALEDKGYEVMTCLDGIRTLELVKTSGFDLLILDIKMPGLDGEAILGAIFAENIAPKTRVLVITGFNDYENTQKRIIKQFSKRVAGYVQKPVDVNQLYELVAKSLRKEGPGQ